MTNIIASDSGSSTSLNTGDRLYVPGEVTLAVAGGVGIASATSTTYGMEVFVDGTVVSLTGNAIVLQDEGTDFLGDNRLIIGETGVVRSLNVPGNSAVYMLGSGSHFDNAGEVSGQWGAFFQRWSEGVAINSGRVSAIGESALYFTDSSGVSLTNTGQLISGDAGVEGQAADFDRLLNTGEIIGGAEGYGVWIKTGDAGSLVVNRGLISGGEAAVQLSSQDDVLRNRGEIDGDVRLGGGDDVYRGGKGAVDGRIDGQAGADLLIGGRDDDLIFGGVGKDEIRGGRGDDIMQGGGSADLFVVGRHGGDDVIRDLTHGKDHLDLSAFDLNWKPLKNNLMSDTKAGVLIDLEGHGGGTVLLRGAEIADFGKGDFIL